MSQTRSKWKLMAPKLLIKLPGKKVEEEDKEEKKEEGEEEEDKFKKLLHLLLVNTLEQGAL